MLRSFRYFLFPFSIIYWVIIFLRNKLYDWNVLKSAKFNFPVICVGNLAVGGTGKTPMTEYLIDLLQSKYQIATLSRGYKRKTKGFAIATTGTTALEIGDEPMQFFQKFPNVTIAVGEERIIAIPQILHQRPTTEVIILDDAFQHRAVRAGLNILLTEYNNLYTRDLMFPAGDLRDIRLSSERADIIIVTKCKESLSEQEKIKLRLELETTAHSKIFFTTIDYQKPIHLFDQTKTIQLENDHEVLLLCGIANPSALKQYLNKKVHSFHMLRYADHHIFSSDDLLDIKTEFGKMMSSHKIIITTEKDAVRLSKFKSELMEFPIYVIPIQHRFLFNEGDVFNRTIVDFVEENKNTPGVDK